MSEEIILKDLTSISPYKGGPSNEWFVTSKNHKPIALFTKDDEPWEQYPIVEIRAVKTKREVNGKTFVVYDAVDIVYDYLGDVEEEVKDDGIDLNSLSVSELKDYINSKAPKTDRREGLKRWAQIMGYMSVNLMKEKNKIADDENYRTNRKIDNNFNQLYSEALYDAFGEMAEDELPVMEAANLNINSPSVAAYYNGASSNIGDLRFKRRLPVDGSDY